MNNIVKYIIKGIQIIIALAFIFLIGMIIGLFAKNLWSLIPVLLTTDSDIAKAIVSAACAIVLAVVTHAYSKKLEKQMQIEEEHRKHKIEAYEKFFDLTFGIIKNQKENMPSNSSQADLIDKFYEVTQLFIIWSSDEVISAWTAFRLAAQKPEFKKNPLVILPPMERLMKVIRKDLGHKHSNLKEGQLLMTFINDYNHDKTQDINEK